MKIWNWKELANFAARHSPYYAQIYADLPRSQKDGSLAVESISELPAVEQSEFWQANTVKNNQVFTAKHTDGIVFKSGGTTGNPKYSIYSREEWDLFTKCFGEGLNKTGMCADDKVANLFYVGELYASFIFIMKCIESSPTGALQYPIAGSTKPELIIKTLAEFDINVLSGLPTTVLALAEFYSQNKQSFGKLKVNKIFFGGESLYPDQKERLLEIFENPSISSIGYASVDAGLLGYADSSCQGNEHRCFGTHTIFEIVDERSHEPILEPGRPGKVLLTNLIRSFMPIIRYPAGDRAVWTEPAESNSAMHQPADRKFRILGRSEEAARVGPVSVYYEDMKSFLDSVPFELKVSGFQLIVSHFELKDCLTLRLGTFSQPAELRDLEEQLAERFGQERKMFQEASSENKIHGLRIEWVSPSELEVNARTGKLRRVIDLRS